MQKYLPSKQFVRIIFLAVLGGLVIFFVGKIINKKTVWNNNSSEKTITSNQNQDYFSQDTDGDGLYDWEEALWGTNSTLKDTDGDGIDDKKYVENKRKTSDFDESYKADPSNETEAFAKQFFTTASVLNQNGGFNQDAVDNVSNGISQSIQNFSIKDKYSLADLKLSGISVLQYKDNISQLFNSLDAPEANELTLIAYVMQDPTDKDALAELGSYMSYINSLINGLLSMNVPNSNAGLHLSYINNLYKMSEIVQSVVFIEDDPVRVMSYLSQYDEYSSRIVNNIDSFKKYFIEYSI